MLKNNDNIQIYIFLHSKLSYNFIVGIGLSSTRAFFIKPIIFGFQIPIRMHHVRTATNDVKNTFWIWEHTCKLNYALLIPIRKLIKLFNISNSEATLASAKIFTPSSTEFQAKPS
jgi:hypothetical protein